MADRLTKTPTTWFVQCSYCKLTNMGHETELLDKARRLCKNHRTNHFLAYVTSELDTLDHSILNPISEIEILTQIHNQVGCNCLAEETEKVDSLTKLTQDTVHIPQAYTPPTTTHLPTTTKPTKPTTPKTRQTKPGKTLLERLQNGRNDRHN